MLELGDDMERLKDLIPFNWYMLMENAHKHMQFELEWLDQLQAAVAAAGEARGLKQLNTVVETN